MPIIFPHTAGQVFFRYQLPQGSVVDGGGTQRHRVKSNVLAPWILNLEEEGKHGQRKLIVQELRNTVMSLD